MKQEEFLARLSELAEWEVPYVGPNGCAKKPRVKKVVIEDEFGDEIEEEIVQSDTTSNDTLAPVIKKIKNQCRLCEDCGEIVENRITSKRMLEYPVKHWREKCNCGLHKDPNTGVYCLRSNQELQDAFRRYLVLKQEQ